LYAPGVTEPGSTSATPVNGIDWYPTLLELAGVGVPSEQDVDGVSLVPLLEGEAIPERPLFWHYPHYGNQGGEPSSILMEDQWKLIFYHEDGRYELYNLEEDIGEQNDVADRHPDRLASMKSRLQAWLTETSAKFPKPDPQFDPEKREARWENLRTVGKRRLEQRHAEYLQEDFSPNEDW
jgi:arylsulfatase A-like enzyme